jgi:hypothetical protein
VHYSAQNYFEVLVLSRNIALSFNPNRHAPPRIFGSAMSPFDSSCTLAVMHDVTSTSKSLSGRHHQLKAIYTSFSCRCPETSPLRHFPYYDCIQSLCILKLTDSDWLYRLLSQHHLCIILDRHSNWFEPKFQIVVPLCFASFPKVQPATRWKCSRHQLPDLESPVDMVDADG